MKSQALFSQKNEKKNLRMLSVALLMTLLGLNFKVCSKLYKHCNVELVLCITSSMCCQVIGSHKILGTSLT